LIGKVIHCAPSRLAEHAAELLKAQPDVIFAAGNAAIRAAQQATKTIPILAITDDMVGSGLVRSLVKPEGNTTGLSNPSHRAGW
jgi:putative ABC transport system substrate-binding protein